MKQIKTSINNRLIGFVGSILLIISEFLPWFSGFSCFDIYILYTFVAVEESFLYLFPLISGIICLIGSILIIFDRLYKINSVLISLLGLGFLILFLFEIIPDELFYLPRVGIGFYFCIAGFLITMIGVIVILLSEE
ncbi:MAG: hypothetical protein ACFFAH_14160 [Promethearchaeota archaeon]